MYREDAAVTGAALLTGKLSGKSVCLVCHPYTALKDIGAGADRYAYELFKHYQRLGIASQTIDSGIIRTVATSLVKEVSFQWRLRSIEADIYHAIATVPGRSALRQADKRPLVTTIHDLISLYASAGNDTKIKFRYKAHCIAATARGSDLIIVPFMSTFNQLVHDVGINADKIRLVPYGIDHEQFYPGSKPENAVKKVLFVGALNKGKGIDSLILAWDMVMDAYPDVELLIGSIGWDTNYVKGLLVNCRNRDKIRFIGFVPEQQLRQAYVDADIFIFPSRYGFGLPTLEAMACGTPTISGNCLDAPEFIQDAGLLVDPDRLDQITDAILSLLRDDALRSSLIEKGLEKAVRFSWHNTALKTAEVYAELL